MSFRTLTSDQIYHAGSDLWVIPSVFESKLAQKINWYVNFQFSKMVSKMGGRGPFLLASHTYLPNRWTIQIRYEGKNLQEWGDSVFKIWMDLGKPSLRIYLPQQIEPLSWISFWNSKWQGSFDGTLIFDLTNDSTSEPAIHSVIEPAIDSVTKQAISSSSEVAIEGVVLAGIKEGSIQGKVTP